MIDVTKLQPPAQQAPGGSYSAQSGSLPMARRDPGDTATPTTQGQTGTQGGNVAQQQGFNFPSQWGTASDIYNYFGTGGATQIPQGWQQGQQMAQDIWGRGGMPTGSEDYWRSLQESIQPDITRSIQQAVEQAGLGGLRYSTPLGQQAARIGGEAQAGIMPQFWQTQMGLQEGAANRMMQVPGMMQAFGAGEAGLTEAAKNRAMQAAGGLQSLGGQYAQLPMSVAQQMMNMGGQLGQQRQQAFSPYYSEFMRGRPEANPYLQMGMQFPYGQFGQQQQMYDPSFMSQLMPAVGTAAGAAIALSSVEFKKDISEISQTQEVEIYEQIKDTPLFNYRYKFESDEQKPHLGLITESSPQEVTMFDNKAVGLYEYISALHATIKVLSKKVEALEK